MAQEILTGNVLSDGVVYHATDINAAVNSATILPGAIENRALSAAQQSDKILVSRSGALNAVNVLSIEALTRANMQTTGLCDIHEGVALSGMITVNIAGTQNDYNPTNFVTSTIMSLNGTATITGMNAAARAGVPKVVYASGTSVITLMRESASSQAANRLFWKTAVSIVLNPGESATFMYFNNRWILLSHTIGI